MLITKSKFLAGTQCMKRLYWLVHSPEMAAQRGESDQSIMEQGREVGLLAQQMFAAFVVDRRFGPLIDLSGDLENLDAMRQQFEQLVEPRLDGAEARDRVPPIDGEDCVAALEPWRAPEDFNRGGRQRNDVRPAVFGPCAR